MAPGAALNEGRSRNPGDTRDRRAAVLACGSTLNEGRSRNPGDTSLASYCRDRGIAQRRPEPKPRRHGDALSLRGRGSDRSTKAGAETPATRVVGSLSRLSGRRSTKAGAETPATLLIGVEHLHGRNSVPDLGTTDCDVDHLFGPYLAVDVVMDPQMPRIRNATLEAWQSAASHTLEPRGA